MHVEYGISLLNVKVNKDDFLHLPGTSPDIDELSKAESSSSKPILALFSRVGNNVPARAVKTSWFMKACIKSGRL